MVDEKAIVKAHASIFKPSAPTTGVEVRGFDFETGFDFAKLCDSFATTGFQATHLAKAIEIIRKMKRDGCTVFLGYTSNMVSSGLRDVIRFLVQHKFCDAIATTAGGVEEDFIKCFKPFLLGHFRAPGAALREAGINRTGNLFVPNDRYIAFEKFLTPALDELRDRQLKTGQIATPSELIRTLGERIDSDQSIYHWAAKHGIPVFCPAITDGAIGDVMFFYKYNKPELKMDIADDVFKLNSMALDAKKTGIVVIGAGVVKHMLCNANMFREGTDYAVYINTASEYDGSDSGAEPEEAVSWGKIGAEADRVKVVGDATILLPLIVGAIRDQVRGKAAW